MTANVFQAVPNSYRWTVNFGVRSRDIQLTHRCGANVKISDVRVVLKDVHNHETAGVDVYVGNGSHPGVIGFQKDSCFFRKALMVSIRPITA